MTVASSMSLGVQTLTLGMAVTFVGPGAFQVIGKARALLSGGGAQKKDAADAAATAHEIAPSESGAAVPRSAIDEETAVAIAAATAAAMSRSDEEIAAIGAVLALITAEGAQGAQVSAVRRIDAPKCVGMPNLWALAGRQDIMAGRNRRQR